MKQTVFKCVTAILCTVAIGFTMVSSADKIGKAQVEAAEKTAEVVAAQVKTQPAQGSVAPGESNPDVSNPDASNPADGETPTDGEQTTEGTTADAGKGTPAAGAKVPSTKAEIISYYNTAINKVISSKAGYAKKRTTSLDKLDGADAIMKIKIAKDAVYGFLGVGDTNYTNKKGEAKFLSNANLKEADVKSAVCENNGGIYTITLSLADGKSTAPNVTDNSPLQRCGLYAGAGDKSAYDYKSANNLYVGLNNADNTSVKAISEETKNAKIVIKVDSKTGKLSSLNASWNWDAELTDVKYTFVKISGTGMASSTVALTGVQW